MTVRVPFGKHKGALLSNVPDGYLLWLVGEAPWGAPDQSFVMRNKPFFDAAKQEFKRRQNGLPVEQVAGLTGDMRRFLKEFVQLGYKAMAQRYHPDRGGSTEDMQVIGQLRDYLKGL